MTNEEMLSELIKIYNFPKGLYIKNLCDIKCDYCKFSRICYLDFLQEQTEDNDLKEYINKQIKSVRKRLYELD